MTEMPFHYSDLDNLYLEASAITVGSFDGVHKGHQNILSRLKTYAVSHSIPATVITFFPHPSTVLRNIQEPYYLTLPDERASVMFQLGVDYVITIPFTRALSNLTPFEFMEWLSGHVHPKYLVVGEDFALGKDRVGNPEALEKIGRMLGYELETIPFVNDRRDRVSSSRIRDLIKDGKIEAATNLLGRPYAVPVQISISADLKTDDLLILKMSCDPRQLLPSKGLYETELDIAPDFRVLVLIHYPKSGNRAEMTGLFLQKTDNLDLTPDFTRLSFHTRLHTIPAEILDRLEKTPFFPELYANLKGG